MIDKAKRALSAYTPQRLELGQRMAAAVLVPLYEVDGRSHVLLTKRTSRVEHHKGEVSFPGGAVDPGDRDLLYTALRETYEEIGVHPDDVEIIGQLDDTVTISSFLVAPYVGVIRRSPYQFKPLAREVAAILEVPIDHLRDPANRRWERRRLPDGREVDVPAYVFAEHVIFGATARMLGQFLELISGGD